MSSPLCLALCISLFVSRSLCLAFCASLSLAFGVSFFESSSLCLAFVSHSLCLVLCVPRFVSRSLCSSLCLARCVSLFVSIVVFPLGQERRKEADNVSPRIAMNSSVSAIRRFLLPRSFPSLGKLKRWVAAKLIVVELPVSVWSFSTPSVSAT